MAGYPGLMKLRNLLVLLLTLSIAGTACGDKPKESADPSPKASATNRGFAADSECAEYADSFAALAPEPGDPGSFTDFKQVSESMDKIADEVPDEIADDFMVLSQAYGDFAEGTGNVDLSDPEAMATVSPEQLQKLQDSLKALDNEQVRTAVANIEKFVQENCPEN